MTNSFLLLSCSMHTSKKVANQLREISGVEEAIPVHGVYDCVVKTKKISPNEIQNLVSKHIRPMPNVHSVLPLQLIS
ncbi:AsnC family transcriptional regulator protein [Marine Group I thaumarchaeote SCGC AAA799-E16]|uniref:AsnC domain containing protein n=3 Tax=Marine Group I TaxID=905826 RepID=A0A081RMV8_9ARCH|nr:AsnC domain containing protein [Marine Group I thaumarchaeote SCGC AAA799-N04]KER05440.1 AsnC family transcriptional regulator protein [Marine Group I thaumarchaeote SCGC AAA799-E16]KFM15584.1 AsnC domain containing protein [Marine Group I thaumarchaeote SCGC AAA799-D11]